MTAEEFYERGNQLRREGNYKQAMEAYFRQQRHTKCYVTFMLFIAKTFIILEARHPR